MFFLANRPPKDKSVSLTILILSFIALVTVGVLHAMGRIENVSVFPELWYSSVALYFGRRFSINGKAYIAESTQEKKEDKE